MAETEVIDAIRQYLTSLGGHGIHARRGILFGSHANGTAHEFSDIDLVVLAPEFDAQKTHRMVHELWRAGARMDAPIQPIACGEREWEVDDERPIIEVARREGIEIKV